MEKETQLLQQAGRDAGWGGAKTGRGDETEDGVEEEEPTDDAICSAELVMADCSGTCF